MADTSSLDPRFRPYADWLLRVANANGIPATVTSAYRSVTTQRQLYAAYLAGRSKLPAAPPGRSKHQYGLAVDIVFSPYTAQMQAAFGALWQRIGGTWHASDPVHFEA